MRLANRFGRAVAVTVLIAYVASQASAATIFRDNFSDGNAEDGMPVLWDAAFGSFGVESKSLVIESHPFNRVDGAIVTISDVILLNASVRFQFRLLQGVSVGLAHQIGGGILDNGVARIGDVTAQTGFDPINEDLIMQVDYTSGGLAELWIWRPGESMPSQPLLSAPYLNRTPTHFSFSASNDDSSRDVPKAAFRYVHVADSHIPEPSTLLLAMLSMAGTCCYRRRH